MIVDVRRTNQIHCVVESRFVIGALNDGALPQSRGLDLPLCAAGRPNARTSRRLARQRENVAARLLIRSDEPAREIVARTTGTRPLDALL